ncbi:hypothetical protein ASD38_07465 [Caulobacter sp. Root487D2Y]|nr:hypothetical protein ASD38_07465 [Caulobacter sp. Root487D2Y]
MLVLAARQQALAEVLLQIRRLIGPEATPDAGEPDQAYQRLKTGWRSLHAWLEEAGRESRLELRLLRSEQTHRFASERAGPWVWLRDLIHKRRSGSRPPKGDVA